ncbi:hypothetical protein MMC19_007139 [Ptychographa xylographoides]|nr:hypothetical protein [Ptychographa xylographoides]
MTACVHDGLKGQGGVSITPDGFVFIVVNPYTIDVANTCMAPLEPRRMDVAQCVLDLAARSAHIANIPQLPPGPSTQAANIPDQQLPNSPPITEEDRDFLATYFGDIDPEGAGAGPASAGPSDGTYAFSNRLLPPAPLATRETQQVINLGNSARTHEVIAGTWWLTKAGWVPAKGRRLWKTCGSWFLLRGIGQPVPFPIGAIPEWNGGVIEYRPRTDAGAIISEAWIEENGRWKPLEGVVPQPGPWLRNGGLLLLRGADGAH